MNKTSPFIDHGIPVQADETRTAAVCINGDGEVRIVINAKGYVLGIDPISEECKQYFYPYNNRHYPYTSLSSRGGYFYTGARRTLLCLDPFRGEWVIHKTVENREEDIAFRMDEGPDGRIYMMSYPNCRLTIYDPITDVIEDHGVMDGAEKYPGTIVVDNDGWIYIGIGTEHRNIIAYHCISKEKRSLVPSEERIRGAGYVHRGLDGRVYGHYTVQNLKDVQMSEHWYTFTAGQKIPIKREDISPSQYSGSGFRKCHRSLPDGRVIELIDLAERVLQIHNPTTGEIQEIALTYQSEGAELSTLVKGSDGKLYGTSKHPMQFFRYDSDSNTVENFGGVALEKGGGGNVCAYALQGTQLIGTAYAGGKLYHIDLTSPFVFSDSINRNPKLVAEHAEIHRPRCALAYSDGTHVVYGGYPDYGMVGGALGIYNISTRKVQLISHLDLIPFQSVVCLGAVNNGDIVAGTSIETPGGASPKELEAKIFRFDWRNRKITKVYTPIPNAREISLLFIDSDRLIHGVTSESLYFVFDMEKEQLIMQRDLSGYGGVVREGFVGLEGAGSDFILYLLLSRGILRITKYQGDSSSVAPFQIELLTGPPLPITSGAAIINQRIYFSCGSRLYSYPI